MRKCERNKSESRPDSLLPRLLMLSALITAVPMAGCLISQDNRPQKQKQYTGKHYFGDWVIHKFRPYEPVSLGNPLTREEALQRELYLTGTYDDSGNLVKFVKYLREDGEPEHHREYAFEYTYGPDGKLQTIVGKNFDEDGDLYRKSRRNAEGKMLGRRLTREDLNGLSKGDTERTARDAFGKPGAWMHYGKTTVLCYPDKGEKKGGFCFEFRRGKLISKASYSGYYTDCDAVDRLMHKRRRQILR